MKSIVKFLSMFLVTGLFIGCAPKINTQAYQPVVSVEKHFDLTVQVQTDKTKSVLYDDMSTYIHDTITKAIKKSQLFSKVLPSHADVKIIAHTVNINSPVYYLKVDTIVEIAWIVLKNNNIIFKKSYITKGNASPKEERYGSSRAMASIQKAVQKNIELSLKDISRLNIE